MGRIAKSAGETTLDLTGVPLAFAPTSRRPRKRRREVVNGVVRCQRCESKVEPKRRCYECMVRQQERAEAQQPGRVSA